MTGSNYNSLRKLWEVYELGVEDHVCAEEEFSSCQICERSWEARTELSNRLTEIVRLLERYHDCLDILTRYVIQEVPLPRPDLLQMAMLRAVKVLEKDGKTQ